MFLALLLSSLLTFVELNCENLFDTRHDSLKNDGPRGIVRGGQMPLPNQRQ